MRRQLGSNHISHATHNGVSCVRICLGTESGCGSSNCLRSRLSVRGNIQNSQHLERVRCIGGNGIERISSSIINVAVAQLNERLHLIVSEDVIVSSLVSREKPNQLHFVSVLSHGASLRAHRLESALRINDRTAHDVTHLVANGIVVEVASHSASRSTTDRHSIRRLHEQLRRAVTTEECKLNGTTSSRRVCEQVVSIGAMRLVEDGEVVVDDELKLALQPVVRTHLEGLLTTIPCKELRSIEDVVRSDLKRRRNHKNGRTDHDRLTIVVDLSGELLDSLLEVLNRERIGRHEVVVLRREERVVHEKLGGLSLLGTTSSLAKARRLIGKEGQIVIDHSLPGDIETCAKLLHRELKLRLATTDRLVLAQLVNSLKRSLATVHSIALGRTEVCHLRDLSPLGVSLRSLSIGSENLAIKQVTEIDREVAGGQCLLEAIHVQLATALNKIRDKIRSLSQILVVLRIVARSDSHTLATKELICSRSLCIDRLYKLKKLSHYSHLSLRSRVGSAIGETEAEQHRNNDVRAGIRDSLKRKTNRNSLRAALGSGRNNATSLSGCLQRQVPHTLRSDGRVVVGTVVGLGIGKSDTDNVADLNEFAALNVTGDRERQVLADLNKVLSHSFPP
nr:MAG TPA: hypothetical protein [Caudoviricetes sp.]